MNSVFFKKDHMNKSGFTFIEIVVVLLMFFMISGTFLVVTLNNMGATEQRARKNASLWVAENNISIERFSCAGDSDQDGYGSCSIKTKTGEMVYLSCPASFGSVNIFGAKGCKEVEARFQIIK